MTRLSGFFRLLLVPVQPQDIHPVVPGVDVDVPPVVHHHVLGGGDHRPGHRDLEQQLLRVGGDEVGDKLGAEAIGTAS